MFQAGAIQTSIPGAAVAAAQSRVEAVFQGRPAPNVSTVTIGSACLCRPAPSGAITLHVGTTSCSLAMETAESQATSDTQTVWTDKGRAAENVIDDRQRLIVLPLAFMY